MALNKQVHVYSVDTSAFYNDEENNFAIRMNKLYFKRNEIKIIPKENRSKIDKYRYKMLNKHIKNAKARLKEKFEINKGSVRELRKEHLKDSNIVSVFESSLTRTAGFKINEITTDVIIVRAFYFDILHSCILNGFILNGEKYKLFTASAGQIRTKKSVFIKESLWNKHANTLTCGLSIDRINERGGINVNKYLAYLALTNSATDKWEGFDIEKCIVVDDFETTFKTRVDFINEKTYEIKQNELMNVTIPHMDGCGICLPKVNRKPFMIRAPWVKGLIVPFQYNSFVKENRGSSTIKDIYGKEYDIFKDDIQIIFTKSQFKTYKYYNSWDEYKENFKKYNCEAGSCNEEPERIKNAKINYQMIQTLTDVKDEELEILTKKLNRDIYNISRDRDTMLKSLGVHEYNFEKNSLQQALELYPELLQDEHCRQILRDTRKKLVKEGKSARFPVNGKYTFLIPDLYAFCEWLFLGERNPKGILKNGEVACKLYDSEVELDVLRSPHLFLEHSIRKNKRSYDIKRWFITKGIYTSVHDPISRILQFDVDGDKALVIEDSTLINVANRNIEKYNILPLYYDMAKADPQLLTNQVFYNGMINAYSGGNIGAISNDITKIWNSEGNSDKEMEEKLKVIKYLCMENNFVIDYAKTLYKPTRPDNINDLIRSYTKAKTPKFFIYAKDKKLHQVEELNDSTVNRLENIVKDVKFNFKNTQLGKFDLNILKHNKNIKVSKCDFVILDLYNKLNREKNRFDYNTNSYTYTYQKIKEELLNLNFDKDYIIDILIEYLFSRKASKLLLFECFGEEIVKNIKNNINNPLGKEYIMCKECGKRVKKENNKMEYCKKCAKTRQSNHVKNYKIKQKTKK